MRRCNRRAVALDRKSTRLNSSHSQISYAVFCLKKKKTIAPASTRRELNRTTVPRAAPLICHAPPFPHPHLSSFLVSLWSGFRLPHSPVKHRQNVHAEQVQPYGRQDSMEKPSVAAQRSHITEQLSAPANS